MIKFLSWTIWIFALQLMHYVRSEHRLSDSHIPIQADYALNGQFVSNWEDIFLHNSLGYIIKRSTLFLKPHVELITLHFVISFLIQYTATIFVIYLFYIVFLKLIQHYRSQDAQNPTTSSSAYSLHVGVRICLILFGLAMFATELSYTNNFNYDHYLIKTRLIIIFVTFGIYTITHNL